jgi:small-conductance mechanosensitive channel
MRFVSWAAGLVLLVIAALRLWAAWVLYRRIQNVPPSRQRAAHLIVLSTLSASLLGTTLAVTVGLAALERFEAWSLVFFIILCLGVVGVVPGIVVHLRRYGESWLEEGRRGASH